jgi:GxxExxY protein
MVICGSDKRSAMQEKYPHSELTGRIIGCAMKVHNTLGNGFQEVIYQRALKIELTISGIPFVRELEMDIHYEGKKIGTRRVDFLVAEKVMVELKAISCLEKIHLAQGLNYLEAYQLDIGLLINFGANRLEFNRLINQHKRQNRR